MEILNLTSTVVVDFYFKRLFTTTSKIISMALKNPIRLPDIAGYEERKNDIVYSKPLVDSAVAKVVIFFPGDVQDYIENMEAHRDNKHHKQWNLEGTASILQKKFPENHILVVKPSRMDFKTFSCFQNFVQSSQLGIPEHIPNFNSLNHLEALLKNISERIQQPTALDKLDREIVGFSKGCVVLNQFVHEFHYSIINKDQGILNIIKKIKSMYWLDGGHSGGKNTWIVQQDVLTSLCSLDININIHVTPYQIQDDRRPWIKKEEKTFSDFLQKHSSKITRLVHFEAIPPSIITHFDVINSFKK
ncbi:unnamed protein product [Ceutorhynchus assimilis]|uniref:Uncharacterized protein n=1 Tax=Ceutorhynchus assimilis TaxID=467358 RepID=A0A9N9MY36_9CUCU|nr:unnamed protein product [Ceutorhynchus assimilis]